MSPSGRVLPAGSLLGVTALGATRPLRRIPAMVPFLNPEPAFSLVGGTALHAPTPAIHYRRRGGFKLRSTERRLDLPRQ